MKTEIIETSTQFSNIYKTFKESATKNKNGQNVFVVGFDIEFISKANYPHVHRKADWILNKNGPVITCIIQVSTNSLCLIINLVKMKLPLPNNLIKIIKSSSWIKTGVGIDGDLSYLSQNYNLGHCGGGIEMKNLALLGGYKNPNLESLFNTLVGANVKKRTSVFNWSLPLSEDQYIYAAQDAIMSYKIFEIISKPMINLIEKKQDDLVGNKLLDIEFTTDIISTDIKTDKDINSTSNINYIGILNEYAQKMQFSSPTYKNLDKNNKNGLFQVKCTFSTNTTIGKGSSKKKAKSLCAKNMLDKLNLKY